MVREDSAQPTTNYHTNTSTKAQQRPVHLRNSQGIVPEGVELSGLSETSN